MITSETPYKLAEIIRDTWPNLYRPPSLIDMSKFNYPDDPQNEKCPYCGEKGKPCSYVNSMARAYARGACKKNFINQKGE
jgi:hypothetical protein